MATTLEENRAAYAENRGAYEKMRDRLEEDHFLEWAVFYDGELVKIYNDSEEARRESWMKFGLTPYLIKQIGEENLEKKRQHLAAAIERRNRYGQG